jgi:hypothetical protein
MSKQAVSFRVRRGGRVEFIYNDAGAKLLERPGVSSVKRASHVEPHPRQVGWIADMRPSGGPILGADSTSYVPHALLPLDTFHESEVAVLNSVIKPFPTRQAALDAEVAWLKAHRGL